PQPRAGGAGRCGRGGRRARAGRTARPFGIVWEGGLPPGSWMKSRGSVRRYLLQYRARLLLGLFFILCGNAFGLLTPVVLQRAIDDVTRGVESGAAALGLYAGLIVLLAVLDGVARF